MNRLQKVLSNFEDEKFEIELSRQAVSPDDIYTMITNKMINFIKEANQNDYKKKWEGKTYGTGYLIPFNFQSKKRYRGINFYMLRDFDKPLENPFYLTFKQIGELGGKVKKGSFGHEVVYFTRLYTYSQNEPKLEFGTYDEKKFKQWFNENKHLIPVGEHQKDHSIPILKYYKVFNGKDIEGVDFDLENFKVGYINKELPADEPMPIADAIVKNYPTPKVPIKHGGDKAVYYPGLDYIKMPHKPDFETTQDYYRTLFHELGHSTGHPKRLKRDLSGRFGSKKYAFEELIAELNAVFVSAEAGFLWHTNKNHAAYIKGWNTALTHIKDDNRFVMRAATQAQKATDFILQPDAEGNPLYLKTIEVEPKTEKAVPKKLTRAELEAANPKGFAKKPKSVAVSTAIKDVLRTPKYKNTVKNNTQASILYKHFKENPKTETEIEIESPFEDGILKQGSSLYLYTPLSDDYIGLLEITEQGVDFVNAVKNRRESLLNQKNNLALFEGLTGTTALEVTKEIIKLKTQRNRSKSKIKKAALQTKIDALEAKLKKGKGGNTIGLKAPTSSSKETTSFNKQILQAKRNGIDSRKVFSLGKTKGILKKHIGNHNLTISGETIKKAMDKDSDHIATFEHFINLPDSINSPTAIFKSKTRNEAFVVLTEIKTHKEKPLMVALHVNNSFKIGKVASVYNRNRTKDYKKWRDAGLAIYINKKPFDALLSGTIPVSQTTKGQSKDTKKSKTTKKGLKSPAPIEPEKEPTITLQPEPQQPAQQIDRGDQVVPEAPVRKNSLMDMEFDTLNMDQGWQHFMQHPAANMKIAIWGKPKNGKTSGALQLANYLTKHGPVLYNFADQGFNKSTQDLWKTSGLANKSNATPSDIDNLNELEAEINNGNYKFVFIDMINDYINRDGISPQEFKDRFIKKHPNTSFVLVFETTKDGNFKGDQAWTHIVDAIVTVENFLMENRGRYGIGHFIVWEEGLKKFNPKRYEEIMEETQASTIEPETLEPIEVETILPDFCITEV